MKRIGILATFLAVGLAFLLTACSKGGSSGADKVIKSTKSGNLTVTLSNATGELKRGENELFISFADASGKLVDVGAASLNFHMAGMGTMAEMNDKASLTTTDTPGKYRAKVDIEMASTWEAVINYQGPQGNGQAVMTINVK
jgi:hypothetical protein